LRRACGARMCCTCSGQQLAHFASSRHCSDASAVRAKPDVQLPPPIPPLLDPQRSLLKARANPSWSDRRGSSPSVSSSRPPALIQPNPKRPTRRASMPKRKRSRSAFRRRSTSQRTSTVTTPAYRGIWGRSKRVHWANGSRPKRYRRLIGTSELSQSSPHGCCRSALPTSQPDGLLHQTTHKEGGSRWLLRLNMYDPTPL
jgi:hypothetical protein